MKQIHNNNNQRLTAKDRARLKIMEYLSNPDNEFLPWVKLCHDICGYANSRQLFELFTIEERREIEQSALFERRKNGARQSAKVDQALFNKAVAGDVAAIKLWYQRIEGWSEKKQHEFPDMNCKPQNLEPQQLEVVFVKAENGRTVIPPTIDLKNLSIDELNIFEKIISQVSESSKN